MARIPLTAEDNQHRAGEGINMSGLQSFDRPLNAAVIGASGGIGGAFVRQLSGMVGVQRIFALSRSPYDRSDLPESDGSGEVVPVAIDLHDESSIRRAAGAIGGMRLDLVIVASGVLHGSGHRPEKALSELDAGYFHELLTINSLAPLLVAREFLPLMARGRKTLFAALSARVGSISDNRLGGWYSYRASKAALNMMLRCLAIESRRRWPELIIAGLHPGTVDTRLSSPFQKNVPADRLFSPEFAARSLLDVIDRLTIGDSGKVFAWDGREIAA